MKVTAEMKIKEVLELGEHLLSAFVWLAPEFERLQHPKLRRALIPKTSPMNCIFTRMCKWSQEKTDFKSSLDQEFNRFVLKC